MSLDDSSQWEDVSERSRLGARSREIVVGMSRGT